MRNARHEIELILRDSPSLRQQLPALLDTAYPLACRDAAGETGLPLSTFPECCPFTVADLLSDDWPVSPAG
jgi:hypothetical protein